MINTKTYEWENGKWVVVRPSRFKKLSSLDISAPEYYEKNIASLYTQTTLVSNSFMNMLDTATPYIVDPNAGKFSWTITPPSKQPVEVIAEERIVIDFTNDRELIL